MAWVASVLVVMTRGILIVGSPLAGLSDLPLAMWLGCCLCCGEVDCHSHCDDDAVCVVDLFACVIDDVRWVLEART